MKYYKNIFISNRLFASMAFLSALFILGYYFDILYLLGKIGLLFIIFLVLTDIFLLYLTKREIVLLTRETPDKFSNGDDNIVELYIKNNHFFHISIDIIDEIPVQFQKRDFIIKLKLKAQEEKKLEYTLRPVKRGIYTFGKTNAIITNPIGLIKRRYIFNDRETKIPVYPSFLNMKKYEFLAISNRLTEIGIKRIRKIGMHSEFDQIRDYVKGDSYRSINWKATAKKAKLMVNQYQDERSQQIYSIIDKGRIMQMPFNGMSLLDYAINASLILSNTAVNKHDKAGLITFNNKIDTFLKAERKNKTIQTILELLYKQETEFYESDFELLYTVLRKRINHRSLIILYTNFESLSSLERQLYFLQQLAKRHLVLTVFFENTELKTQLDNAAKSLEEIYIKTIVEKFVFENTQIVKELNKHGIHSILTGPEDLTPNLVNKYLEFKDIGLM